MPRKIFAGLTVVFLFASMAAYAMGASQPVLVLLFVGTGACLLGATLAWIKDRKFRYGPNPILLIYCATWLWLILCLVSRFPLWNVVGGGPTAECRATLAGPAFHAPDAPGRKNRSGVSPRWSQEAVFEVPDAVTAWVADDTQPGGRRVIDLPGSNKVMTEVRAVLWVPSDSWPEGRQVDITYCVQAPTIAQLSDALGPALVETFLSFWGLLLLIHAVFVVFIVKSGFWKVLLGRSL